MVGIFNSHNFLVYRDESSIKLSREASIPYVRLDYGKQIQQCHWKVKSYMSAIRSSFGEPSFTIYEAFDGPVDCWVISSSRMNEIIYIEHWKGCSPEKMYIFMNVVNVITSSFLKCLYECVR